MDDATELSDAVLATGFAKVAVRVLAQLGEELKVWPGAENRSLLRTEIDDRLHSYPLAMARRLVFESTSKLLVDRVLKNQRIREL